MSCLSHKSVVERNCSNSLSHVSRVEFIQLCLPRTHTKKIIILFSLLTPEKTHFPDGYNIIPEFSPCPISSENAKDLQESCPGAFVWDEKAEEKVLKNYSRRSGGREVLKGQEPIPLLDPN